MTKAVEKLPELCLALFERPLLLLALLQDSCVTFKLLSEAVNSHSELLDLCLVLLFLGRDLLLPPFDVLDFRLLSRDFGLRLHDLG